MIGAAAMRPRSHLGPPGGIGLGRFLRSGFTPKSALPIIAPLGRGPKGDFARERLLVERSSRLLKGPRWGLFRFAFLFWKKGGPMVPFFVFKFRPPKVYENA